MNPEQRNNQPPGPGKSPDGAGRTLEGFGTSGTHVYLDDETLQRMIEAFGPLEYSQFATTYYPNVREQDPFSIGPTWQQDVEWPSSQEMSAKKKSKTESQRLGSPRPQLDGTGVYAFPQLDGTGVYAFPTAHMEGDTISSPEVAQAQRESLMEWFDRSVEKELEKRRNVDSPTDKPLIDPALAPLKAKHTLNLSKRTMEKIAETSASGVEITARLETDFTTELSDAVEKLAKAEAMCSYAEALQAAEEAAQNAPPELVEQAAAAEARRIQTDYSKVKETIMGVRPIEVVGYVGITKPSTPKKST